MEDLHKNKSQVTRSPLTGDGNFLAEWFMRQTGIRVTTAVRENMERAVNRLANQEKLSRQDYIQSLLNGRLSKQPLFDWVVPHSSCFFQQKDQMDLAVLHLIPSLLAKDTGTPVRILSIGCSRGEEPFSLALLLHEAGIPPSLVDIQGIDLSQSAIEQGKNGVYLNNSLKNIPKELFQEHFVPISSDQSQIQPAIRQQVTLTKMNLLESEQPDLQDCFDIIFCRNLLTDLAPQVRGAVLKRVDSLLSPNGFLFLDSNSGFLATPHFQAKKLEDVWLFEKTARSIKKSNFTPGRHSVFSTSNGLAAKLSSDMTLQRAESSLLSGHLDRAISLFDDILVCHPSHAAQALMGKARALLNLGKYRDALNTSELALAINTEFNGLDSNKRAALKSLIKNLIKKNRRWANPILNGKEKMTGFSCSVV